jgi:hypothetical protein
MGEKWLRGMIHPQRSGDATLVEAILQMIERKTADIFAAQIRVLLAHPDAQGCCRRSGARRWCFADARTAGARLRGMRRWRA